MAIEQVAAGLFNYDPVRDLQAGTSMGAQMMEIALRSQQQMIDMGNQAAQIQLASERNALSRRAQMFNEMTSALNRFDQQAKERQAQGLRQSVLSSVIGGGTRRASTPSSPVPVARERTSPTQGIQTQPVRRQTTTVPAYVDSTGFNTAERVNPEAPVTQPDFTMRTTVAEPGREPIGGFTTDGSRQFVQQTEETSFNASAPVPSVQDIVRSSRGEVQFDQGPGQVRRDVTIQTEAVESGQQTTQAADLPNFLQVDENNRVSPAQLHGYMRQRIANSDLNGFVPADGERFGITTGSPEEWADYFTGLANVESGFRATTVGDRGRFPGNSNGLFQLSPQDSLNHNLRDTPFSIEELQDPTFNADAAVKIHESLVLRDGVIAEGRRGAARYWGPLRRGVLPQQQAVVQEARQMAQGAPNDVGAGEIPGMAGGPGVVDAGLFPPASRPDGQVDQEQLYSQFPEYRALQETDALFNSVREQHNVTAAELTGLRQRDLELRAAMSVVGRNTPEGFLVARELAGVQGQILELEQRNNELKAQESTLLKSRNDAEAAWKVVRERQNISSQFVQGAEPPIDPEQIVDQYVQADGVTRLKMRARFQDDPVVSKWIKEADTFIKEQRDEQGASRPEEETVRIRGTEYTIEDLNRYRENPVIFDFLENNPKIKEKVDALGGGGDAVSMTEDTTETVARPASVPPAQREDAITTRLQQTTSGRSKAALEQEAASLLQ